MGQIRWESGLGKLKFKGPFGSLLEKVKTRFCLQEFKDELIEISSHLEHF